MTCQIHHIKLIPSLSRVHCFEQLKSDFSEESFRIHPFKANMYQLMVPNKHVKTSVRTKPIIVSQPHDDCVRQYVNGMKSRKKNQSANVSKSANQKKHKAQVWKPKNIGSKERFASPRPSKPRSCLSKFVNCSTKYQMEKIKLFQVLPAVTTADASDKCQQQQDSTSSTSTLATTITADGNFDL
ncbi:hypothetical protein Tco_1073019 [Tanacetum coccineum]